MLASTLIQSVSLLHYISLVSTIYHTLSQVEHVLLSTLLKYYLSDYSTHDETHVLSMLYLRSPSLSHYVKHLLLSLLSTSKN